MSVPASAAVRRSVERVGYGSESAFSTAFKRELGVSPLHYRRQARGLVAASSGGPSPAPGLSDL
ncbi:AraC-type DNA-binding domain-containing proteins [Isoptericola variabilis J7]|nr:AraC-type DNA-binding domain-containing proteins [Isoptericola variabilis J7]